jgi:ribosome-associated heat shock protein Hsp15
MNSLPSARIDKWLWAARLYRTRSAAIAACHAGHVKVDDTRVKPARAIRPGDILTVVGGGLVRTLRVRASIEQRVGAALVPEVFEDLTPPEEFARAREARQQHSASAPRSGGRPTKRDRRQLQELEF